MRSPLAPIRQAADDYIDADADQLPAPEEKPYDVFVCHAFEDKEEVVRPLALALRDQNLAVWYDEFELRIGDVLRRKIDEGLTFRSNRSPRRSRKWRERSERIA